MDTLILASASPRRKELLQQVGIPFRIQPSEIDERTIELVGSPEQKVEKLAYVKAFDVAKNLSDGLVLGADTIVVMDEEIFGKPSDKDEARKMLTKLSGREHIVITGIALINSSNGESAIGHEITRVKFSELSQDEIKAYIDTGEPEGKAGAYAVQGRGALLIDGIEGCYANVVGLPLMRLRRLLEGFGITLLNGSN